ncbi:MAG TPA: HlyD family efflux transporter periplasmic adaptor subunit [Pseudolabrys sp.]
MADQKIQEGSQTPSKSAVEINRAAPQEIVPSTAGKSPIALWRPASPRRWRRIGFLLLIFAVAAGAGGYWLKHSNSALPVGIASGNGRIEADEIDIATKFPGRIAELLVDEGSTVGAGQVVARMDTRDLQASLQKAQAQVKQAEHALDETHSNVEQQRTQLILATQEWERTQSLLTKGFATRELSDQRRQQVDAATAALNAANSRVEQANHALEAAQHEVELLQVNIADNALVAPRDGRIQYRIANLGEVLPAGGKVLTMLDLASVYIDIYLPTADTGKAKIGDSARIVLDAYPTIAIPATVSFISDQAQFTPKAVETRAERDKLMFRVRVRVDPDVLRAHRDAVKSGVPGVAYVQLDPNVAWPDWLRGSNTQ